MVSHDWWQKMIQLFAAYISLVLVLWDVFLLRALTENIAPRRVMCLSERHLPNIFDE